jgi:hypothetical protein
VHICRDRSAGCSGLSTRQVRIPFSSLQADKCGPPSTNLIIDQLPGGTD